MTRDDAHWQTLYAKRDTIPTAEQVERSRTYQLTKYTSAQVIPVALDLCDANDEAVQAYAVATEFIHARTTEEERQDPAWTRYVAEDVAAVIAARWECFEGGYRSVQLGLTFEGRRSGSESYPLSKWRGRAIRYRRMTRELLKAVELQTVKA